MTDLFMKTVNLRFENIIFKLKNIIKFEKYFVDYKSSVINNAKYFIILFIF